VNESTPSATAAEVKTARQLYWVTIIAGGLLGGPPPPRGSTTGLYFIAFAIAWLVLILAINIRAMRRSGLSRSGIVAPCLTVLFLGVIVMNVIHLASEMSYALAVPVR